jgi:hypothetical protein
VHEDVVRGFRIKIVFLLHTLVNDIQE